MPSFPVLPESEGFCFYDASCGLRPQTAIFGLRTGLSITNHSALSRGKLKDQLMYNYCKTILLSLFASAAIAGAATLSEDFTTDPALHGWQVFGDTNLFHWNATNQNLEVTWDSSQPDSYFHHPLGTILSKSDDFSLAFDLRLADIIIGSNTNKPYTFQFAIGLINFANATDTNYLRGTGYNSPNLVEFDYFPDSGFGATVDPVMISTNNGFSDGGFTFPLEMAPGNLFHISMSYTASNQTLVTSMIRNGQPFGPVADATLSTNFTDFRVDQVAISSYSDAGQDPSFAGSILAHGTVDSFLVTTPVPLIANLTGGFSGNSWQVQFLSSTNWLYTMEKTTDFQTWSATSPTTHGTGGSMTLTDTNAPGPKAFYRVGAMRP
jgi:hypothetical protein